MAKDFIPNNLTHNASWIYPLASKLSMTNDTLELVLQNLNIIPNKNIWHQWLTLLLLSLGSGLLLTGVMFFFAYNWEEMHRFTRFSLLGSGVVLTSIIAFRLGLEHIAGKLSITAAAVLTGVLLATFGMVYQTGADSYLFFGGWAVLILPWVIINRFQVLWFIELVVSNIALLTWSNIYFQSDPLTPMIMTLIAVNGSFLFLREKTSLIHKNIDTGRWFPRTIALFLIGILTIQVLEKINYIMDSPFIILLYFIILGTLSAFYTLVRRDLLVLVLVMGSLIISGTALISTHLSWDGLVGIILGIGLFISLSVATSVHLLLKLSRQWKLEENNND
ncbi:MAG: DUF2157 domain-containing protein [Thiotrichaceae bacterium]|nr:DUF2157 domain-containing protein [Thiotrichaceae bacterium]